MTQGQRAAIATTGANQPAGAIDTTRLRPAVRADLALVEGYHSPQVAVSVRLNTNESPEPPPAALRSRLAEAGDVAWNRYPDRSARGVREAVGRGYGLGPEQVFVANGSNEVLQTLLLAYAGHGRRVAVFEPTYALHSHIARITGATVVEGSRAADFSLDLGEMRRVVSAHQPEVVFLCSPNNPTGMVDAPETVGLLLDLVEPYGGLVVVDEAYGQFASHSAVSLLDDERNLVVSRTFSKTWSMAALRLGYLLGPAWAIEAVESVALPYHVDTFKQRAGALATEYRGEMLARVATLVQERERLVSALADLDVDWWPSGANFVLFRPRSRPGRSIWDALLARDVLVRDCSSWRRLDGCLRVTIGAPAENDAFVAALAEALNECPGQSTPGGDS